MEHFIRVVMEKQKEPQLLDESIFKNQEIYESAQGATVFQIELPKQLSEQESDEYAANLANMMFEAGYSDFDIEVSADGELDETDEITYEDDDEFYEDYLQKTKAYHRNNFEEKKNLIEIFLFY